MKTKPLSQSLWLKETKNNNKTHFTMSEETSQLTEEQQPQGTSSEEVVVETAPLSGFRKRLSERYKDSGEDFSNDEVYEKYANQFADDNEAELKKYHDADNVIKEVFDAYPEFKQMITDVAVHKVPPRVAMARQWSTEDLTPQSGDDDYEQYVKEFYDRKEKNKKQKDFEDELYKNLSEGNGVIDEFIKSKGFNDEQKEKLIKLMDEFLDKSFKGITDNDMLEIFAKAMSYDKAIADARAAGELIGRNANIEAKMEEENHAKNGDGLPTSQSNKYQSTSGGDQRPIINMGSILSRYK